MMFRALIIAGLTLGGSASWSLSQIIGEATIGEPVQKLTVPLMIFCGSIAATAGLAWKLSRWVAKIEDRLRRCEEAEGIRRKR